jgi:putative endopeptidase
MDSSDVELEDFRPLVESEDGKLYANPVTAEELLRLRDKHRKLMRSFKLVLIFSCTLLLLVLFFTYNAYQIRGVQANSSSLDTALLRDMNRSADPCQDFYEYACGGWLSRTQLEPDQLRQGRSFDSISESNRQSLLELIQQNSLPYATQLYRVCSDLQAAEDTGLQRAWLQRLAGAESLEQLYAAVAQLQLQGASFSFLFELGVTVDEHRPTQHLAYLWQGSPLLPDASYYEDAALLAVYTDWLGQLAQLSGLTVDAAHTVQLERALLSIANSPAQNRDPQAIYNLRSTAELAPDIAAYVRHFAQPAQLNLAQPRYFAQLNSTLQQFPFALLRSYAQLRLLSSSLTLFGVEQRALAQQFRSLVYGVQAAQSRERFCLDTVQQLAGWPLAQLWVEANFDAESRTQVQLIITLIEQAYLETVEQLDWMDAQTKAAAGVKLRSIRNMVGYPQQWPQFSSESAATLAQFYAEAVAESVQSQFAQLQRAVDPDAWDMLPTQVNAYYQPTANVIVFPAGILQPPFYSRNYSWAANFGGIGSVIGHELGHSLDDQGSQYNWRGALDNWWSNASRANFERAAACVARLYSSYSVQPGLRIDGELVLGESIADLAGLRQSYSAYKQLPCSSVDESAPQLYNMSADQLFFVAFAQSWCSKATEGYERMLTETNPHPVSRFRVLGSLSQSAEFAYAFNCPVGTPYNPAEKCELW